MIQPLDLRDLLYFETIAEMGHLGRAAKKLLRTQPALTGCIRRLEERLGVKLFERVGRGIRPTSAGRALLVHARRLRMDSEGAIREMSQLGKGLAGQIRVGAVPTAARFLLPAACREFLQQAPEVTVKTVIAHNDLLRAGLKAGELDLVITFDLQADDTLAVHELLEDEVVVVAREAHPIFKGRAAINDLPKHKWVLAGPGSDTRQWLDRAFVACGLPPPTVQLETNLVLLLPPLIERSDLLSFISRQHLSVKRGMQLRAVEIKETTMRRRFVVTHQKDSYLSAAALRFIDLIQNKGRELFQTAVP